MKNFSRFAQLFALLCVVIVLRSYWENKFLGIDMSMMMRVPFYFFFYMVLATSLATILVYNQLKANRRRSHVRIVSIGLYALPVSVAILAGQIVLVMYWSPEISVGAYFFGFLIKEVVLLIFAEAIMVSAILPFAIKMSERADSHRQELVDEALREDFRTLLETVETSRKRPGRQRNRDLLGR